MLLLLLLLLSDEEDFSFLVLLLFFFYADLTRTGSFLFQGSSGFFLLRVKGTKHERGVVFALGCTAKKKPKRGKEKCVVFWGERKHRYQNRVEIDSNRIAQGLRAL